MPAVVHGNPTHSAQWLPFLRRGGPALAIDLPGWGRSDSPAGLRRHDARPLRTSTTAASSSRGRRARPRRPRLGGAGADRRPAAAGAVAPARGDQRGAAAAGLPLALGGAPLAPARWGRRNRTTTRAGLALQAPSARRPRPDAGRARRDDLELLGPPHRGAILGSTATPTRTGSPTPGATSAVSTARRSCFGRTRPLPACALRAPVRGGARHAEAMSSRLGHWPWLEDPGVVDRVLGFLAAGDSPPPETPPSSRKPSADAYVAFWEGQPTFTM